VMNASKHLCQNSYSRYSSNTTGSELATNVNLISHRIVGSID